MQTKTPIKELLDFYIEAGVTEVIGESPVNHFNKPATPPASVQATVRSLPAKTPPVTSAPKAAPSMAGIEAIEAATKQAAACNSAEELHACLQSFDGCSLKKLATNTVFSRGNVDAKIMIIDRPASSEEDRTGLPFAGANGELFSKMLASIGLSDDDVYMGCCLPWRPPGGRPPTREEQSICLPFIKRHIELVAPQTLILTGEAAAFLLETKTGINRLRGKWHSLELSSGSIQALPIFHPAFLLQHPASKRQAWTDLLNLKAVLEKET